MRSFVWSQFRFRRSRTGALALAILVAAVSFTLLTASTKSSSLHVHGTLKSSYRPAYDILVRPPRSQTKLEREERLVRPNFLSGLFGGITLAQWKQIERTRGVAVAAPIANIGYVLPLEVFPIPISHLVNDDKFQLYRIRQRWIANGNLSQYPDSDLYVYYTPDDLFRAMSRTSGFSESGPNVGKPLKSCDGFRAGPLQPTSPFPPVGSGSYLTCFPSAWQQLGFGPDLASVNGFDFPHSPDYVGTRGAVYFPLYITAIDPVEEAKLVHLDRTVVHGRYLRPNEGLAPFTLKGRVDLKYKLVPILASTRTFVDEHLELTIERLRIPSGIDVPRLLATGSCAVAIVPCPKPLPPPSGSPYRDAHDFAKSLPGKVVERRTVAVGAIYRDLLRNAALAGWKPGTFTVDSYWTTSPTQYRRLGRDHVAPVQVHNPETVWASKFSNFITPPRDNLDPQFRSLHGRVSTNLLVHNEAQWNPLQIVGEFDPSKLPSFSPLSQVPLETYAPPTLMPADDAAKRALDGRPLLPNQNLAGYIQQPPLFLTTMQGLKSFLNPKTWQTATEKPAIPASQRRAPISAIRVKVAGVTGPDPLSLERVRLTAQRIHEQTGLAVDITAGSSPHPMLVSLPKGNFGQPPLLLREGWSKKGVTVAFLRALDRKDLGLFALILVICGFFLGNGALASVHARRAEIGTLLTLGWSRAAIFSAVLTELAIIGLAAGAVGSGLAAALAATLDLHVSLVSTLLVLPIAVGLAVAAGTLPAWLAARGRPLDALRPAVTARRRARSVRRLGTLAVANLTRVPARTLLGASGLALGVAALSVLFAIERAFQGTLVGTVLGSALSVQVHGADFAAVALTITLAALSVADVLYLNLRERAAEIVTLKTIGWAGRHITTSILLEGLGLGLIGSLTGGLLGLLIGAAILSVPIGPVALACLAAAAGGTAAALLASILPLTQLARLTAPAVLASE
jgi:ABC-type antimicrobial peptide transport system permease subunit